MLRQNQQPLIMEITIVSAQGLKNTSSALFSHRLRPFITLTTVPPTSCRPADDDKHCHVYRTRVDDEGGINPAWGDKFKIPLDAAFFSHRYSSVYLNLYTKRLVAGQTQLGWCQIPAADIVEGLRPAGAVRHLSYRLREVDGSRGHGVVNIAVRLEGTLPVCDERSSDSDPRYSPATDSCQAAVGIPVSQYHGSWPVG